MYDEYNIERQRRKVFSIPSRELIRILQGTARISNLPDDAVIEHLEWVPQADSFDVLVWSVDYNVINTGGRYPQVQPEFEFIGSLETTVDGGEHD